MTRSAKATKRFSLVPPEPDRSVLDDLRAELEEAKSDALWWQRGLDEAEDVVDAIAKKIDAIEDDDQAEPPLRVATPKHVKLGWSVDISANALAKLEREAAAKLPKEGL